jgi:hypothetical protein
VFCLGLITIVISLSRFIAYVVTDYNIDDAAGSKSTSGINLLYPIPENATIAPSKNLDDSTADAMQIYGAPPRSVQQQLSSHCPRSKYSS